MAELPILDVRLYGEPIGTLTLLPGDRVLFAFREEYIANPDRPTLSLKPLARKAILDDGRASDFPQSVLYSS